VPVATRLLKSMQRLGSAPRLSARARKVRISYNPAPVAPVVNRPGMNGTETRLANALDELRVRYIPQVSYFGGDILGGARADFLLPDYQLVLLPDGPFHNTSYGRSRDILSDMTYKQMGLRVVHFPWDWVQAADVKRRILDLIGRPA
jgi:very-short-patch-repair endonuclease